MTRTQTARLTLLFVVLAGFAAQAACAQSIHLPPHEKVVLKNGLTVLLLEKHGVPCSPYLTVSEALRDPQVEHRGSLCTIEDSAGTYQSPAPPFRFSGSALQSGPKVAGLGEHTASVLAEAGLSEAEIKTLVK